MNFKVGCHVSIAGGVWKAPKNASDLGCETFQIFTRSPQGGAAAKLEPEIVQKFREEMEKAEIEDFVIHAPYYINFGSPKAQTRGFSTSIVRDELERGSLLGASFVMFHPGSINGNTEEGFAQAQVAIGKILDGYKGSTQLLLEISAGAGQVLGDTFEELKDLSQKLLGKKGFGGICFDTQHAYASGYDIATEKGAKEVLKELDKELGLENLRMSHVNDSKIELGGHKDRHEHIGDGHIGKNGLKNFFSVLDAEVQKSKNGNVFPLILETEHDKVKEDIKILKSITKKG